MGDLALVGATDTWCCIKICGVGELALVGMCLHTWHMWSALLVDPFSICGRSLGLVFTLLVTHSFFYSIKGKGGTSLYYYGHMIE